VIDGEDEFFDPNSNRDWEAHWRTMFKKISAEDIKCFFDKYKDSDEERKDLANAYEKHKGNMNLILEEMFSDDLTKDETRFKKIIEEMVEKENLPRYDEFFNESKRKASKRKARYEQEAKEAEQLKKEMGIDESQESLRNAILARQKKDNFIDKLEQKYAKKSKSTVNAKTKTKKRLVSSTTRGKKAAAAAADDDDDDDDDDDEDE
jgi:DnaJ homolog subfamily C member 9